MIQGLASEEGEKDSKGRVRCHYLNPTTLPKMLEPKGYTVEVVRDSDFINPNVVRLYVWDSTGKKWGLPKKRLKELIRLAKSKGLI